MRSAQILELNGSTLHFIVDVEFETSFPVQRACKAFKIETNQINTGLLEHDHPLQLKI